MDLSAVREHCLSKPGATEDFPFGPEVLVFRVCGKLFCLMNPDERPPRINLKCRPDEVEALRDRYAAVLPGYHMNKRHWNTVLLDGDAPSDRVREWIDDSYALVVAGLTKRQREPLAAGEA
ncbi:MAG: MmcQ/YjbR family DNA-binding protein [Deltaproteobacteria bacterium]|nr:MAG: MmcQ/YjbR family DNA-binding protein [Deltaproteobacteria bacterium]